jgi:hypothetical protein
MTPIEEQAIKLAQELRNKHCKNSHLAILIFKLENGFASSKMECNNPNQTEAIETTRESIADNLNSGGKPVAVLVSALGAPIPQLEIFPEFEKDGDFCYQLKKYADSL